MNGTLGNVAFYNGENVILGKSACYFNLMGNIDKHIYQIIYWRQNILLNTEKMLQLGSTIRECSIGWYYKFLIPVPPITEQYCRIIREWYGWHIL